MTLTSFADPESPNHKIQALLLPPQVITQANVNDVVKAGASPGADLQGIESPARRSGSLISLQRSQA